MHGIPRILLGFGFRGHCCFLPILVGFILWRVLPLSHPTLSLFYHLFQLSRLSIIVFTTGGEQTDHLTLVHDVCACECMGGWVHAYSSHVLTLDLHASPGCHSPFHLQSHGCLSPSPSLPGGVSIVTSPVCRRFGPPPASLSSTQPALDGACPLHDLTSQQPAASSQQPAASTHSRQHSLT